MKKFIENLIERIYLSIRLNALERKFYSNDYCTYTDGSKFKYMSNYQKLETVYLIIRKYFKNSTDLLLISGIVIEKDKKEDKFNIEITLKRPGMLIGKGGKDFNSIKKLLEKYLGKEVNIFIKEDKNTDLNTFSY